MIYIYIYIVTPPKKEKQLAQDLVSRSVSFRPWALASSASRDPGALHAAFVEAWNGPKGKWNAKWNGRRRQWSLDHLLRTSKFERSLSLSLSEGHVEAMTFASRRDGLSKDIILKLLSSLASEQAKNHSFCFACSSQSHGRWQAADRIEKEVVEPMELASLWCWPQMTPSLRWLHHFHGIHTFCIDMFLGLRQVALSQKKTYAKDEKEP